MNVIDRVKQFFLRSARSEKPPLVIICGPTASGKTGFSLELAAQLDQGIEIISADSRQVYQDMSIFSGAASADELSRVPHHLVAVAKPNEALSAQWFCTHVRAIARDVARRGKIPVVVGGSGFWIQSLLFVDSYPKVDANQVLRNELEQLTTDQLFERLRVLDPARADTVDSENPRRLMRSIEIATALGQVPKIQCIAQTDFEIHLVYIEPDRELSRHKITKNVHKRFEQGLLEEAQSLRDVLSPERFVELGLAYKHIGSYWAGSISIEELQERTITEEVRYAKRQRTFFKKMIERYGQKVLVGDSTDNPKLMRELLKSLL